MDVVNKYQADTHFDENEEDECSDEEENQKRKSLKDIRNSNQEEEDEYQ